MDNIRDHEWQLQSKVSRSATKMMQAYQHWFRILFAHLHRKNDTSNRCPTEFRVALDCEDIAPSRRSTIEMRPYSVENIKQPSYLGHVVWTNLSPQAMSYAIGVNFTSKCPLRQDAQSVLHLTSQGLSCSELLDPLSSLLAQLYFCSVQSQWLFILPHCLGRGLMEWWWTSGTGHIPISN